MVSDGSKTLSWTTGAGTGNVIAAANITDHTIVRGNGGAKGVQDSGVTINDSKAMFINDSTNTNMTMGLTINQAAYDDEILAFKSSDVAVGVTDWAETDTYANFMKEHATAGGLRAWGFSGDVIAHKFIPVATNDNTVHGAAGLAPFMVQVYKKSGTDVSDVGADANLVALCKGTAAKWILDEDGDTWQDGNLYIGGGADATLESGDILYIEAGADGIYSFRIRDTVNAEAPNMYIGAVTGKIFRTTAGARKYKTNIKDLELDTSLLYNLRPISFTSKCKDDDKNKRFVGLLADEVEQIYPSIIGYNDKNEPETINYRAVQIIMLAEIQNLRQELDELRR